MDGLNDTIARRSIHTAAEKMFLSLRKRFARFNSPLTAQESKNGITVRFA